MDKEKIIGIIIAIVVVVIVALVVTNVVKSSKKQEDINQEPAQTIDLQTTTSIEESFKQAVSEARTMYTNYGSENFDVYMGIDFVNNYMENGKLYILDDINVINFEGAKIYSTKGEELEEFPTTFEDGTEITYENQSYKVEPNKNYLLRIYSYDNSYSYYYILKYDKNGFADIKEICYTIGEMEDISGESNVVESVEE